MAVRTEKWVPLIIACAVIAPNKIYAADFFNKTSLDGEPRITIFLDGPIEQGDAEKFRIFTQAAIDDGKIIDELVLSSPGGSLVDGMEIGRISRELRVHSVSIRIGKECLPSGMLPNEMLSVRPTVNVNDCSCASACALAWLGGVTRGGIAEVHRAYLDGGTNLSYSELDSALASAYADVEEYLREMRVPPQVYDSFLKTSSVALTEVDGGDVGGDPIWQEFLLSHCVNKSVPLNNMSEFNILQMEVMRKQITGEPLAPSNKERYDALKGPVMTYKACLSEAEDIARIDAQHHDRICQPQNEEHPVYQKICR